MDGRRISMQLLFTRMRSSISGIVLFDFFRHFPAAATVFLLLLPRHTAVAALKLPGNAIVPAAFAFGDSLLDTGNNNYIETLVRSNFPPYGKDFAGGKPTGRFSNGKVPTDHFVADLGIKELLPPYLDPDLQIGDLLTGVNFASGGAGYDNLTSQIVSVISLEDQLKLFEKYKEQIKGAVGETEAAALIDRSVFLVAAGADDFTNNYFGTHGRRSHFDVASYADLLDGAASDFLRELYGAGARRIAVVGLPPLGCLPSQRTRAGGLRRDCSGELNRAAQMLNAKLVAGAARLNRQLPGGRIVYAEVYDPLLHLIENPEASGFRVVGRGCCGTGMLEVAVLCNRFDVLTCREAEEYVFWDAYHLTDHAYRIFARRINPGLLTALLISSP